LLLPEGESNPKPWRKVNDELRWRRPSAWVAVAAVTLVTPVSDDADGASPQARRETLSFESLRDHIGSQEEVAVADPAEVDDELGHSLEALGR
jgi:protein involved in temperature-dependent protein secretion